MSWTRDEARQVFQDADKDKSGSLTKSEIRKYFKKNQAMKLRILGEDFQWKEMFAAMDTDGDKKFDLIEFTNYLLARSMFQDADKDKDGFLAMSEIKKYFEENPVQKDRILGPDFHWKDLFTDMDTDGDNKFDVYEFTKYLCKNADKDNNGFLPKSEKSKYFKKNSAEKNRILGSDFEWNDFFTHT